MYKIIFDCYINGEILKTVITGVHYDSSDNIIFVSYLYHRFYNKDLLSKCIKYFTIDEANKVKQYIINLAINKKDRDNFLIDTIQIIE